MVVAKSTASISNHSAPEASGYVNPGQQKTRGQKPSGERCGEMSASQVQFMHATCDYRTFSHPDFTVGLGIPPNRALVYHSRLRAVPPVRT